MAHERLRVEHIQVEEAAADFADRLNLRRRVAAPGLPVGTQGIGAIGPQLHALDTRWIEDFHQEHTPALFGQLCLGGAGERFEGVILAEADGGEAVFVENGLESGNGLRLVGIGECNLEGLLFVGRQGAAEVIEGIEQTLHLGGERLQFDAGHLRQVGGGCCGGKQQQQNGHETPCGHDLVSGVGRGRSIAAAHRNRAAARNQVATPHGCHRGEMVREDRLQGGTEERSSGCSVIRRAERPCVK